MGKKTKTKKKHKYAYATYMSVDVQQLNAIQLPGEEKLCTVRTPKKRCGVTSRD
jgi:hypothetical protein